MANSQKRSFGQELNIWIQTLGIIIAAVWGVYTFIYKEILIPKSAPINITLGLQLHKIGENSVKIRGEKSLIAIEMKVSATNPSSRTVYLLPNIWWVYGEKIQSIGDDSFNDRVDDSLKNVDSVNFVERHAILTDNPPLVATGLIFDDQFLRPGETIVRSVIFHVPAKEYDLLEANSYIPTTSNSGLVELEWKLNRDTRVFEPHYYRVTTCVWWRFCFRHTEGERKPIEKDELEKDENSEFQAAASAVGLSLWH